MARSKRPATSRRVQQAPDAVRDDCMPPSDVPPSESQDRVSRDRQAAIPIPVGLEGSPGSMCRASVDLDDQAGLRPEEVDDVVEQRSVYLRLGKAVAATEHQEPLLELAAGGRRSNLVTGQHSSQLPGTRMPGMATQEFNEVVRGQKLQSVCFINRALKRSCVNRAPEVEDCSGGARRGNLPVGGELVVGESPRTMDSDTASSPTTGARSECHVDQVGFDLRSYRPERRGGTVAQHCAMAAR
jgi:hypothetical protein